MRDAVASSLTKRVPNLAYSFCTPPTVRANVYLCRVGIRVVVSALFYAKNAGVGGASIPITIAIVLIEEVNAAQ